MRQTLQLLLACCAVATAAEEDPKYPTLVGRSVTFVLTEKGRAVDRLPAAFADGAVASPWFAKYGFPSPQALTFNQEGKINKKTIYNLSATSAKGDALTATFTIQREKGAISGQLSIVRKDGTVRNFILTDAAQEAKR